MCFFVINFKFFMIFFFILISCVSFLVRLGLKVLVVLFLRVCFSVFVNINKKNCEFLDGFIKEKWF